MNFQAAVTAIAYAHLLADSPLGWLSGLVHDAPDVIMAETGGPGDDVGITLQNDKQNDKYAEVQIKKGLRNGAKLWSALEALASGIASDDCDYGVLAVCPNSSANIREKLAQDIVRLGEGRSDNLSDIGAEWLEHLKGLGLDPAGVCSKLRIHTISALMTNHTPIEAAQALFLCVDNRDVSRLWDLLYKDASEIIERRGRRDTGSLIKCIRAANIEMRDDRDQNRALMLDKISDWNHKSHAHFSVLGLNHKFDIDKDWIELSAVVPDIRDAKPGDTPDFAKVLADYYSWQRSGSYTRGPGSDWEYHSVDPETLGRFVKRGVVLAGPGIGKTTLLNRIVRRYSEDCIPVLRVRLRDVVASMRDGGSFEQAIFELGLDGSGLSSADARAANFKNWLLLGDGLDECGDMQADVAADVERFSIGYPDSHIILTSRPVGYEAGHFSDWRHYYLMPLDPSNAAENVLSLLRSLSDDEQVLEDYRTRCDREFQRSNSEIRDIVGRTPMMIGLAASILAGGQPLGRSRQELFEQVFVLIEDMPKRARSKPAGQAILSRFLDILGWHITNDPLLDKTSLVNICASSLSSLTSETHLVATERAEELLRYWDDVGLIEKIGLGGNKIYCFTHKSIGEYAAARHFCNDDMQGLLPELADVIDDPKWDEMLHYASSLGVGDQIAKVILTGSQVEPGWPTKVLYLVHLLSNSPAKLSEELLSDILEKVDEAFRTGSRDYAKLGLPLAQAAARYPAEIASLAKDFMDNEHVWVRLTAWNCLLAAGPEHLKLGDLIRNLPKLVEDGVGVMKRSLTGGIKALSPRPEPSLTEELALSGCSYIGDHASPETVDAIVPGILQHEQLRSSFFVKRAQSLIDDKGWTFSDRNRFTRALLKISEDQEAVLHAADLFWLDALGAAEVVEGEDTKPGTLLTLSAFAQVSRYWEVRNSDVWAWAKEFDPDPARSTIQIFARVYDLDASDLRMEAIATKKYLLAGQGKPGYWRHESRYQLSYVDYPEPDRNQIKEMEIDTAALEAALYHPSKWIVWMAGTVLRKRLDADALQACVTRLLAGGKGYTLWAASGLAEDLPGREGIDLVVERLKQDFKWGKCHEPLDSLGVMANGRFANATAHSFAELWLKLADPGCKEFLPLIYRAFFDHWREHEELHPVDGDVVTKSPRAVLVKARRAIEGAAYQQAMAYSTDEPSDVSGVGMSAMVELFEKPEYSLSTYIADVKDGNVGTFTLSFVLEELPGITATETSQFVSLLQNSDEEIRFAAMGVLDPKYLDPDQIREYLLDLSNDPFEDIRDRAERIRSEQC